MADDLQHAKFYASSQTKRRSVHRHTDLQRDQLRWGVKDKGLKDKGKSQIPSPKDLTRGDHGRRAPNIPAVAEPVVAAVPRTIAPAQETDEQAAVRVAVADGPEEDLPRPTLLVLLPALGDEMLVLEQGVHHVRVQGQKKTLELRAQLEALNASRLLAMGEVENHLLAIDVEVITAAFDRGPARTIVPLDLNSVEGKLGGVVEADADRGVGDPFPELHLFGPRVLLAQEPLGGHQPRGVVELGQQVDHHTVGLHGHGHELANDSTEHVAGHGQSPCQSRWRHDAGTLQSPRDLFVKSGGLVPTEQQNATFNKGEVYQKLAEMSSML